MDITSFIWMNGSFVPWEDAKIHILTHTLHYGLGVFEGIRVYKTSKGPAIFRLQDHVKRLYYSASAMKMEVPWSEKAMNEAIVETVRKNKLEQGYIRPIIYFGYGKMGLNPKGAPVDASVSCWPWGKYLAEGAINVKIVKTIRLHPKSGVTDAKVTGHYFNSINAVLELAGTSYDEALLLDYKGNIAEGPGENFFMVKKGVILTPPLGTILKGITRDTVVKLARDLGYPVKEQLLKPKDILGADEAFFTGTAAEITPIGSIDDQIIAAGKEGSITSVLKNAFMGIVTGKDKKYEKYLTIVK